MNKKEISLLVVGLLIVSAAFVGRYLPISDALKGFITGVGLMLEFLAIAKISKKNSSCRF